MPGTSPIAAAATIALHAAMLAAVMVGLDADPKTDKPAAPLTIRLIAPEPAPAPVAQSAPAPPAVLPKAPKPERRTQRPRAEPRPAPESRPVAPARIPDTSAEAKPAPAAAQPAPAAAAPLPAPPAAPAWTSASEASYASTNRVPPYPRISLSNGEEGTVILRVLVTPEGTAGAVEVRTSSGYPLLDESARKTVMTWRFKPATVDGKPVAEWYQVPIPFKLQNN